MQLLILIALLPAFALAVYIYRKDGIEHEPVDLLFRLAGFGALSCVPAALAEMALSAVIRVSAFPPTPISARFWRPLWWPRCARKCASFIS